MKTKELIKEIQRLPDKERFYVFERSMYLIRKQEDELVMENAAVKLYDDYINNEERTAFISLE